MQFRDGRGLVPYMDDQADNLGALIGNWDQTEGEIIFTNSNLSVSPTMDVGSNSNYFTDSKDYLAGEFEIGPFTDLAIGVNPEDDLVAYIVYHDLVSTPVGNDGDFDVFLVRGVWDDQQLEWNWESPVSIVDDPSDDRSDQFMPTICVDGEGRVHVAY